MKTLATSFRSDGFDFLQLKRVGDIAIYQKSKPHWKTPGYEVVVIQKYQAFRLKGKDYEAGEKMPSSEQWGTYGFSCMTLERAEERLNELVKKYHEGNPA